MYRKAPLPSSFMLIGILGFFVTIAYWHRGSMDNTWGVTLVLFFAIIFVSSLVSLRATVARLEGEKKPIVVKRRVVKAVKRKPVKKVVKAVKKPVKKKKAAKKKR